MEQNNNDAKKRLAEMAQDSPPSTWREKAEYRKANNSWLRKSTAIALKILDVLAERNMTKVELANRMNISRQQVNEILKGKENLTLKTISELETALNIILLPEYEPATNENESIATDVCNIKATRTQFSFLSTEKTFRVTQTHQQIRAAQFIRNEKYEGKHLTPHGGNWQDVRVEKPIQEGGSLVLWMAKTIDKKEIDLNRTNSYEQYN